MLDRWAGMTGRGPDSSVAHGPTELYWPLSCLARIAQTAVDACSPGGTRDAAGLSTQVWQAFIMRMLVSEIESFSDGGGGRQWPCLHQEIIGVLSVRVGEQASHDGWSAVAFRTRE